MNTTNCRRLSVSSWSLHRTLGSLPVTGPTDAPNRAERLSSSVLPLLDLPRRVAHHGIETMEICHFHLVSTKDDYLRELRTQLEENRVELWSLLIDGGDLTGQFPMRDFKWIANWIEVAAKLGARNVRVIAGQAPPTQEILTDSIALLRNLSQFAQIRGVRLMTENWFDTLGTPAAVHRVFGELPGQLDLCLDFGNWEGPDKYEELASIARYATSCHARADFCGSEQLDADDFRRCLQLTVEADFHGPYTIIPSGYTGENEWVAINDAALVAREFCE